MATTNTATQAVALKVARAEARPTVNMLDRIKSQLSAAALRQKISVDDLSDLEQHIKKLAGFLGV